MAGFATVGRYADAFSEGRVHSCTLRKAPAQSLTASWWFDLSSAPGNPKPNYYASSPLVAATLDGFDGIFHGDAKTPSSMHLAKLGLTTQTAAMVGQYKLLDYLLYYPFVDGDEASAQAMANTIALPRYTDGAGVRVMAVSSAPSTGSGVFTFDYVNQDGASKTSPTQICSTSVSAISYITSAQPAIAGASPGPFLTLASGDTGVRSITSATFSVANGGLFSLVLVKPLADLAIREINTTAEVTFVQSMPPAPRIYDGAYLGLICRPGATATAGALHGSADFVWSE